MTHEGQRMEFLSQGTTQSDRVARELGETAPRVDEFQITDFLNFVRDFSGLLRFWGPEGAPDGTWAPFFDRELIFAMSDIARTNLAGFEERYGSLVEAFQRTPLISEKQEVLARLFVLDCDMAELLLAWRTQIVAARTTDADAQIVTHFEELFTANVGDEIAAAAQVHDLMFREFSISPNRLAGQDLASRTLRLQSLYRKVLPAAGNPEAEPAPKPQLSGPEDFWEFLAGMYRHLLATLGQVRLSIPGFLDESLGHSGHSPHVALLLAFYEMMGRTVDRLNGLTEKHLDFQYKTVLGQTPRQPTEDQVWLLLRADPSVPRVSVPKGTSFSAGTGPGGKNIIYRTDRDLTVTQAAPASFRKLINGTTSTDPGAAVLGFLLAYPQADSADGFGAAPTGQPASWPGLGIRSETPASEGPPAKALARLGFTLASPILFLRDGRREIRVRLTLEQTGLESFFANLRALRVPNEITGPAVDDATGGSGAAGQDIDPSAETLAWVRTRLRFCGEDVERLGNYADLELVPCLRILKELRLVARPLNAILDATAKRLEQALGQQGGTQPSADPTGTLTIPEAWTPIIAGLKGLPDAVLAALDARATWQTNLSSQLAQNPLLDALNSAVGKIGEFRTQSDSMRAKVGAALGAASTVPAVTWRDRVRNLLSGGSSASPSGGSAAGPAAPALSDEAMGAFRQAYQGLVSQLQVKDANPSTSTAMLDVLRSAHRDGVLSSPEQVHVFPTSLTTIDSGLADLKARLGGSLSSDSSKIGRFESEKSLIPEIESLAELYQDWSRIESRIAALMEKPLLIHDLSEPGRILKELLPDATGLPNSGNPTADTGNAPPSGAAAGDGSSQSETRDEPDDTDSLESFSSQLGDIQGTADLARRELAITQIVRSLLDGVLSGISKRVDDRIKDLAGALAKPAVTSRAQEFKAAQEALTTLNTRAGSLGDAGIGYLGIIGEILDAERSLGILWGEFLQWIGELNRRVRHAMDQLTSSARQADSAAKRLIDELSATETRIGEVLRLTGTYRLDEKDYQASADSVQKKATTLLAQVKSRTNATPDAQGSPALDQLQTRLDALPNEPLWERLGQLFTLAFTPTLTLAEGWQAPSLARARSFCLLPSSGSGSATGNPVNGIELSLILEPTVPAVVGCDPKTHGAGFSTANPVLRFLLNQQIAWPWATDATVSTTKIGNPYPLFCEMGIVQVGLRTEVRDSKVYSVQNTLSQLDPKAPFQPIGASPVVGLDWWIGNVEMLRKPLAYLGVDIDWFDLPKQAGGFSEYYQAYNQFAPEAHFTNESFQWEIDWLVNQRWHPPAVVGTARRAPRPLQAAAGSQPSGSVAIFSWDATQAAISPDPDPNPDPGIATDTVDSFGQLDPASRFFLAGFPAPQTPDDPAPIPFQTLPPYSEGQANGCLRFKFAQPPYAFGQSLYPKVVAAQSAALAASIADAVTRKANANADDHSGTDHSNLPADPTSDFVKLLAALAARVDPNSGSADQWVGRLNSALPPQMPLSIPGSRQEAPSADPPPPTHPPPPPLPFVPKIKQLRFEYGASEAWSPAQAEPDTRGGFLHLLPFGVAPAANPPVEPNPGPLPPVALLTQFAEEAALLIGLKGVQAPETVSLLVRLNEGSGRQDGPVPPVTWSYLREGQWMPFERSAIRDGTRGWTVSGIVSLALPGNVDRGSPLFLDAPDLTWIRISATANASGCCEVIQIATQAVTARYAGGADPLTHFNLGLPPGSIAKAEFPIPGLLEVAQPVSSSGGRGPENATEFRARVREHLRHKGRAVTAWDWERIVLEACPPVWAVRCLSGTRIPVGAQPGQVTLLVLPAPIGPGIDPLAPVAGLSTLDAARESVVAKADPLVSVDVRSPDFVYLQVCAILVLDDAVDPGHTIQTLVASLIREIAPWSDSKLDTNPFEHRVTFDGVRRFLTGQPGVRAVGQLELRLFRTRSLDAAVGRPTGNDPVSGPNPWTLVTSAPTHRLLPSTADDATIRAVFPESTGDDPNAADSPAVASASGSDVPTDSSAWDFNVWDLEQPETLSRKVKAPDEGVSEALRSLLSPSGLDTLEAWTESDPANDEVRIALVSLLNQALRVAPLWDPARFSSVTLRDITKSLVDAKPEGAQGIRLNRLLLEDAYPNSLARIHDALYIAGDFSNLPDSDSAIQGGRGSLPISTDR